jgi:branched-chain amino acid transport system substrate-binding protein
MSSIIDRRRATRVGRSLPRALAFGVSITALIRAALVAPGAAQTGDSTGVTAKEIKVGYIYSRAGLAGSTFENAADGFNARVKEENAKGGVNGRKIVPVIADDSGSTNNLVAAQNLVQNEKVFLVVNNSPFAFLGYRFLLDNGVPMVGGGYDGNEYGQPGNEKLISILGNNSPVYGAQYKGGFVDLMKKAGAKNVGTVSYGSSASSTAAAKNLQKYPCPTQVSTRSTRTPRSTSAPPTSARSCSA